MHPLSISLSVIFILSLCIPYMVAEQARSTCTNSTSMGVLIPFYIYPTANAIQRLLNAKIQYPQVPIIAILNPNSGVGSQIDPTYVKAIATLKQVGIQTAGYVATGYAQRNLSAVQTEIDTWRSWYKPNGIFLDEMAANHQYYSTLTAYAKRIGFLFTVGNPGTNISPSFSQVVDIINIYEGSGLPNLVSYKNWQTSGIAPNKMSMLVYNMPFLPCTFINLVKCFIGWVYSTNDTLPNPYDTLPPYWLNLVALLKYA